MRGVAVLIIIIIIGLVPSQGKELKRDPDTGMIRVIYIGKPFEASPYLVFKYDPLLITLPIQGNLFGIPHSLIQRSMRLYMPSGFYAYAYLRPD